MKKLLFVAVTLLLTFAGIAQAQSKDEMKVSRERYEKLVKLSKKAPSKTGLQSVDGLAGGSTAVMLESMEITPLVEGLYYRSIGESVDGVADVNVKKPTLDECMELSGRIGKQALAVKATAEQVTGAAEELKGVKNPMAAAKSMKSLDYSKDVLSIIGEESLFQGKAIAAIIETVKSAGNL